MCGFVGVYCYDRSATVDATLVAAQADTLVHRGPDGGGVWTGPGIGLGHRRLSIIDLDGGAQPMVDVTGRYVVAFNGEIYNYRELREELVAKGYEFRTESDTETLLAAYAHWGERCVDHFNGMYAFAVYDRDAHELLLGRDRLGKKPLFYYQDAERIVFGSELKALLRDPMVPREVEPTAVADFFALAYVPAPKTIFKRIHKLPAGHVGVCRGAAPTVRQYWDVSYRHVDRDAPADEHARALMELLEDAVRLRLRSDVPLGAFLSGGLDSSAIVAAMTRASTTPVITQSVGFDDRAFDERAYARDIARRLGTDHHEQLLTPDAGAVVDQLAYFYDEPFGDSSAAPTYYLCQQTRTQVTVALSGDGGDELFTGYDHYGTFQWTDSIRARVPRLLRRAAATPLLHLQGVTRYHPRARKYNRIAILASLDDRDRNAYNHLLPQPYRWRELLSRDLLSAIADYDPFTTVADLYERSGSDDMMSRMQYCDIKSYLCDDILVKVDRASMAHALEVRCPLLDHRIVEYAARIPPSLNARDDRTKLVLKAAIDHLVPTELFERPKQGFAVPIDRWLRTSLKARLERAAFGAPGGHSGMLARTRARRMWAEHQRGLTRHGAAFWNALMFELWFERYVDRAADAIAPTAPMSRAAPIAA